MNSTRILPTKFSIKICLPKSNCEYGTLLIMRFQKYFGPIVLAKPILRKEGRRASGMKKNHSIKPAYCIFAYYTSREQYQSITSLVGGHFGCLDTSKTQFVTKVLMWVKYRTVFLMSSSFHFLKLNDLICAKKGKNWILPSFWGPLWLSWHLQDQIWCQSCHVSQIQNGLFDE